MHSDLYSLTFQEFCTLLPIYFIIINIYILLLPILPSVLKPQMFTKTNKMSQNQGRHHEWN